MLPVQALPPLLRFLDDVDNTVSARLLRKKPWDEIALTSLLCDLLDEETSDDYRRSYPLDDFRKDLAKAMPLVQFDCSLRTHEYPARMERWITQSDIGLVIDYIDHFVPDRTWSAAWLLQAKRAYFRKGARRFDENSKFNATDSAQHRRMINLNRSLGYEAVKYLLFCPRPSALDELTSAKLAHLRNLSLSRHIFDYAHGLALHDELQNGGGSLAAGIFLAEAQSMPRTLADTHEEIFRQTIPLAWFLTNLFAEGPSSRGIDLSEGLGMNADLNDWSSIELVKRIASGDEEAVRDAAVRAGQADDRDTFRIAPAHTLHIAIQAGGQGDPDRRRILNQQ
jgi:hypothetical protein